MKKTLLSTLVLLSAFGFSQAQSIPNPGFENWTNAGSYSTPDGWGNLNSLTSALSIFTCTKGTPGNPGASYLKLVSKSVPGLGVAPGIAVSGQIDFATQQPKSGFAFTGRPTALTGKWQYMAYGSDQGRIGVALTKWNTATQSRDTIGKVDYPLQGMVMSWGSFSIPINYLSSNTPDSCLIVLSASGSSAVANSYLYVDNLAFTLPTGLNELTTQSISVYPNPAQDEINFRLPEAHSGATVRILNLEGKQVFAKTQSVSLQNSLAVSDLPAGIYLLEIQADNLVYRQKFQKK